MLSLGNSIECVQHFEEKFRKNNFKLIIAKDKREIHHNHQCSHKNNQIIFKNEIENQPCSGLLLTSRALCRARSQEQSLIPPQHTQLRYLTLINPLLLSDEKKLSLLQHAPQVTLSHSMSLQAVLYHSRSLSRF